MDAMYSGKKGSAVDMVNLAVRRASSPVSFTAVFVGRILSLACSGETAIRKKI